LEGKTLIFAEKRKITKKNCQIFICEYLRESAARFSWAN